ncbi:MAG: hypothetical protein ACTSU2_12200 [Promethearchaeota archaeon]
MARVIRTIILVFILIAQLSLSLVSLFGSLSTVSILGNENNVHIDTYNITTNVNVTCNTINVTIPFGINNTGLYDFNNFTIEYSVDFYNISNNYHYNVIKGTTIYPSIKSGTNFNGTLFMENTNVNFTLIGDPNNWNKVLNMTLSSLYSLDLIAFQINMAMNLTF